LGKQSGRTIPATYTASMPMSRMVIVYEYSSNLLDRRPSVPRDLQGGVLLP
jgi:hypothetical protein